METFQENDSPPFKGKGYKRETSKDTQIGKKGKPPLSGREASASERKSPIPGGGSSWFVLLTEEKNEQERPYGYPVERRRMTVPPSREKGTKEKQAKTHK